ncbi:hypothetical protein PENSPDRAFT_669949 [Peniophora sp. CONT]|nr:hypothetical protein PENSPDRAFT_669949 [Peniophora sp. CONT]
MSGTGDSPIDILLPNIYLSAAKTELSLQITPSSAPRIRSIDVGFPGYGAVLANVVVESFPALETLCACLREPQYYEKDYSDPEEEAQNQIVTVKTLEIQHAPLLTRVELESCLLPWNANVYSHLTHLDIRVTGYNVWLESEQQRPTHGQLLSIVTSMTAIEELYLDIFPHYSGAAVVQPIHFPPTLRQVTLDSTELGQHNDCCHLAASFVLPPPAMFVIRQISEEYMGSILNHFAGPDRPPLALSLSTNIDLDDGSIIGTVIIPFNPNPWLDAPADLLTTTPAGHITFHFVWSFYTSDEGEDEVNDRDNMFQAMSKMDFSELRVLRISGFKEEEDFQRLMNGYEDEQPILAEANNVEVLVATRDVKSFFEEMAELVDTEEPPFPLLNTFLRP